MSTLNGADDARRFPRGWFVVCFSEEVPIGGVRRLDYFGRELVLFRGDDSEARVLDGHCPHLGAHLAYGGRVVQSAIECPFHKWRFDGSGECVLLPGSPKIGSGYRTRSWPVLERNGLILVYHDPDERAPHYAIPTIDEFGKEGWLPWQGQSCRRIRAYGGDIVENMGDISHFAHVHHTELDAAETTLLMDGHLARFRTRGVILPPALPEATEFAYVSTYHGPAYEITEYEGPPKVYVLVAHTPVTAELVDFRFALFTSHESTAGDTERRAKMLVDSMTMGLESDIVIWEHKKVLESPMLCAADTYIMQIRRWYRGFFVSETRRA